MAGLSQGTSPAADEAPAAGCAQLAAEYDWSESEFGPQEQWDPAVEAVVRTMLEAAAPMAYCHGADYAMVYNDRFADLLGARHPRAWGQRAALVMPEIWSRPGYAEAVEDVFAGGPSFHDEGAMLALKGREQSDPDWAYVARNYSAVRDREGSVLGVLIVVVEIAPVLVGGADQADQGGAGWRGIDLWDETNACGPVIWSGFRAGARPPDDAVSERHLPDVQMVTLAARDNKKTTGTAPLSEFYDVFGMPDGRLAITIGDVMGAGVAAAPVMAQVKVSLRGAALTSSDPNVIFTALDELVSHLDRSWPAVQGHGQDSAEADRAHRQPESPGFGGELFVTALLGIFNPDTGDLLLASAGHFPPAVVRLHTAGEPGDSGAFAEYAELEPGPPLGISGTRPVREILLREGDALVAFTHGLVERHEQTLARRQPALLLALGTMTATAARSISQHVVDTLIGDHGLEHDCALLVVVRDSHPHQMASVLVPPHTIAVRGARRWARAQLESWGVSQEVVTAAVMGVSELVTNVVQHAGTSARVTMELAERLLVTVEDTGTWSAPRTGSEDHSASQGRGLALVGAVSDAMGHSRGVDGSTVWFEIALDRRNT